jgi:WD40 repeat protein
MPVIGGRWRRQAVDSLARDGSAQAVRALARAVVRSEDEEVRDLSFRALSRLARRGSEPARQTICNLVIDHDHPSARKLAPAAGYTPDDPEQRALFFFLTEQWQQFESLDFDYRLLRAAYASANELLRTRIRRKARQEGRVEWVEAVAGGRQGRPLADLTPEEWQTTLSVLTESARHDDLWQLAQQAPPTWSARILRRLFDQAWEPDGEDQAHFQELLPLARVFEAPPLGGLLHCRATLQGHSRPVRCLAFSPKGDVLATGSEDHSVRLWYLPEGRLLRVLEGHEGPIRRLVFSPDGGLLASASNDGGVRLWNVADRAAGPVLEGHRAAVTCLAMSPAGDLLASGSEDSTVRLWRLPDGRARRTLSGHDEAVNCLAITPDGQMLASGSGNWHPEYAPEDGDYTVRLWSLPGGRELTTLAGHRNWVSCLAVSKNGKVLASGGSEVLIWQLPPRKRRRDPDAFKLLLLSNLTSSWANCLAFSPDGQLLASGNMDRSLALWRLPGGPPTLAMDHDRAIREVVFSPDSRVLTSASDDHTLKLWDVTDRRAFVTLPGHTDAVTCLALGPDGQTLASGGADRTVRLWTSELVRLSRLPIARINARDWAWVQASLRDGTMFEAERKALEYVAAVLRRRRRADVVVEEGLPRRITVGEFDVEIEG